MFSHPDSAYSLRTLCTSIVRDLRKAINMQKHAFYLSNKIKQQKIRQNVQLFLYWICLYNAPERRENKNLVIMKSSIKLYNETLGKNLLHIFLIFFLYFNRPIFFLSYSNFYFQKMYSF